MQASIRDGPTSDLLHTLTRLAPDVPTEQLVAVALHVLNASAVRPDQLSELPELHKQLADAMKVPHDSVSAVVESLPAQTAAQIDNNEDQACLSLLDNRLQLLFELWDRDGDGKVGFAEVTLAFRKFCPAMQKLQGTAADAAEAIFLYGDGDLQLDRVQFSRLIQGLCRAVGLSQQAMLDLLIVLAAVDDRPAEEMTLLLAESALQQKFSASRNHADETSGQLSGPHTGSPASPPFTGGTQAASGSTAA